MAAVVAPTQLRPGALGLRPFSVLVNFGRLRVSEFGGLLLLPERKRVVRGRLGLTVRAAASRSFRATAASGSVNSQNGAGRSLLSKVTGNAVTPFPPATGSMEELELELGVCIPFKKYTPEGVGFST